MPKYELMILVDGTVGDSDAKMSLQPIISLFELLPDFEEKFISGDVLAYPIKKKLVAHRFILNFVLEDNEILKKFYKMAPLNNNVLRYLVINLEKDYGYKASINPKKIKAALKEQEKYKKYQEFKAQKAQNYLSNKADSNTAA